MAAKENVQERGKRKPRRRRILVVCAIVLMVILLALGVGGGIGWSSLSREHSEAASLPLNAVDFDVLNDGTYNGVYEGGMYRWRRNECAVTVTNGRVTHIRLVASQDPAAENTDHQMLYDRVISAQSLQVDTISGASLTSKAYLQCVENALVQAQHE